MYISWFSAPGVTVRLCPRTAGIARVSLSGPTPSFHARTCGGVILISRARGLHAGKPKLMLRKRGARARSPRSAPLAICSRYLISIYFSD